MNTTPEHTAPMATPAVRPRRRRWWMPAVIVAAAAVALAGLSWAPELPFIKRFLYSALTLGIALLLLLIWFLFFSGYRWRTRFVVLIALGLIGFGFSRVVQVAGSVDGSGLPRLGWKWTPTRSGEIRAQLVAPLARAKPLSALHAAVAYPGFLGGDRSAVLQGVKLERDWSAHPPEQLWRQPVGLGWSGFAVEGAYAITQEQRGEQELVVVYELASGRTLWMHTNQVRFSEKVSGDGPRATPTISNHRVYALGATGILDCLDLAEGKLIWTRDTLAENHLPNLIWGKSCSPLLCDDLVVVNGGLTNGPALLAYRQDNGSNAWTSGAESASYSSPTLRTLCGQTLILSVNAASLTAHRPADGHVLWRYDWKGWEPRCAQPLTLAGDRVLLSAGFGLGCVLLQVKAEPAGQWSVTELWKSLRLKPQFSSPVVRGSYVYGLDEGVLACLDLATGQRQWKDGHYGYGQVVLIDDLLLIQAEAGPVVLVEAQPAGFREVAHLDALSSKTWNNPAVAGEFLLTRNDHEAVCYRLPLHNALAAK